MRGAIPVTDADYPGYAEAVARENLIRGAACLGLNETICGLEVKPLTAYHVRRLSFARSPFLGQASAETLCANPEYHPWLLHHVMLFLWIVSPMYQDGAATGTTRRRWFETARHYAARRERAKTARDKFNDAFAPILQKPVDEVCRHILGYVDEAYVDADPPDLTVDCKNYFAFEVMIAEELHRHYGYRIDFWNPDCPPEKNPVRVPLKLVFQFRKARLKMKGEGVANQSDQLVSRGLAAIGARHRRLEQYEKELARETITISADRYTGGDDFDYGLN